MRCRNSGRKFHQGSRALRITMPILGAAAFLGVAGCGGHLGNFDAPEAAGGGGSKLANLLGFKSNDTPAAAGTEVHHLFCPQVLILEGTAASQAYNGSPPSSGNLKYQYALTDTARECTLDGDQLAIKIGVAGKVLLGPAGSPGSFSVPVRMAILRERNNEPVTSKIYHAAVTVGANQTEADFTVVSEPLRVPFIQDHAEEDYTIKVGIDEATPTAKPAGKSAKH
jgi:hypothetical protein